MSTVKNKILLLLSKLSEWTGLYLKQEWVGFIDNERVYRYVVVYLPLLHESYLKELTRSDSRHNLFFKNNYKKFIVAFEDVSAYTSKRKKQNALAHKASLIDVYQSE